MDPKVVGQDATVRGIALLFRVYYEHGRAKKGGKKLVGRRYLGTAPDRMRSVFPGRGNVGHVTAANFLAVSSDGQEGEGMKGGSRDERRSYGHVFVR